MREKRESLYIPSFGFEVRYFDSIGRIVLSCLQGEPAVPDLRARKVTLTLIGMLGSRPSVACCCQCMVCWGMPCQLRFARPFSPFFCFWFCRAYRCIHFLSRRSIKGGNLGRPFKDAMPNFYGEMQKRMADTERKVSTKTKKGKKSK